MSERGFESLYYTDCAPGQGLRGGAGFQFQATSAGASPEMMALTQKAALYVAPVGWMREKRPVAEYPPSLTHVFDGVYVTARGVYLGAEVNGVREGNQFTHAVSTMDSQPYGPIRPAQLWDAPWWSDQPAPSTECATVPAEPELGPCGVDAVRDWVLRKPEGESWLIAVHSALERVQNASAQRVVFVGADAEEIIRWITAGTLLLPQERAVRLGFRVFAMNLEYSSHEVLGLHPDWAGPLADTTRGHGFGLVVFNLQSGQHTELEPTDSAVHWVPRFLHEDPYDVIDALEQAYQLARDGQRDQPTTADRLASGILTLGDSVNEPSHARELAQWFETAPSSGTEVRESILLAILSGPRDVQALQTLARSFRDGSDELSGHVRLALLRAEIDELVRGTPSAESAPPLARPWSTAELEHASALIEGALNIVAPEQMDPLLRLATRFSITPRLDRFGDAASRFVRWWADNAHSSVTASRWSCVDQMLDLLRDELAFRLRGPRAQQVTVEIRQRWWRPLLPTINDPLMQLDALVASAAVADGGQPRRDAISALCGVLRETGRADTAEAVWDALFGYSVPTTREMVEFFTDVQVSPSLAQKAVSVLDDAIVDEGFLEVLHKLGDHASTALLTALRDEDKSLRDWLTAVAQDTEWPVRSEHPTFGISKQVLAARASLIASVFLRIDLTTAEEAAAIPGEALQRVLVRELTVIWDGPDSDARSKDRAVALGFLIGRAKESSETVRRESEEALQRWIAEHPRPDHTRVSRLLRADLPDRADEWYERLRQHDMRTTETRSAARRLLDRMRRRGA